MKDVKELGRVHEAARSIKSMGKEVKIDVKAPPLLIVQLAMAVDQGSDPNGLLRKIISEEDFSRLQELVKDLLRKAEVEEFYEKLTEGGKG
jgi:hypothetical protein